MIWQRRGKFRYIETYRNTHQSIWSTERPFNRWHPRVCYGGTERKLPYYQISKAYRLRYVFCLSVSYRNWLSSIGIVSIRFIVYRYRVDIRSLVSYWLSFRIVSISIIVRYTTLLIVATLSWILVYIRTATRGGRRTVGPPTASPCRPSISHDTDRPAPQ